MADVTDVTKTEEQKTAQELNVETVKAFLESNEEGKKFAQSWSDAKVTKALKTYETETLPKLVDKKVKELYPDETEEQKKIRALSLEMENIRNESKREKMHSLALTEITKRGLPTNLVKFVIGTDDETTLKNVEELETEFFTTVSGKVQEQFKSGGRRVPQQSASPRLTFTPEDIRKMTKEEFLKNQDAIKQSLNK